MPSTLSELVPDISQFLGRETGEEEMGLPESLEGQLVDRETYHPIFSEDFWKKGKDDMFL